MPVTEGAFELDLDLRRPLISVVIRLNPVRFHPLNQEFAIRAYDSEFLAELFLGRELERERFVKLLALEGREGRFKGRDLSVRLIEFRLESVDLLGVLSTGVLLLERLEPVGESKTVLATGREVVLEVALRAPFVGISAIQDRSGPLSARGMAQRQSNKSNSRHP